MCFIACLKFILGYCRRSNKRMKISYSLILGGFCRFFCFRWRLRKSLVEYTFILFCDFDHFNTNQLRTGNSTGLAVATKRILTTDINSECDAEQAYIYTYIYTLQVLWNIFLSLANVATKWIYFHPSVMGITDVEFI